MADNDISLVEGLGGGGVGKIVFDNILKMAL
jgi:hypothetical protein